MKNFGNFYAYSIHFSSGILPNGENWNGFVYKIYKKETKELIRETHEWFDSKGQAELAAIGHISLLENGEG